MRVLPDESLPRRLKQELAEHEVKTVPEVGWAGKKNGELLRLAEPDYEVFVAAHSSPAVAQQNVGSALSGCQGNTDRDELHPEQRNRLGGAGKTFDRARVAASWPFSLRSAFSRTASCATTVRTTG